MPTRVTNRRGVPDPGSLTAFTATNYIQRRPSTDNADGDSASHRVTTAGSCAALDGWQTPHHDGPLAAAAQRKALVLFFRRAGLHHLPGLGAGALRHAGPWR